MFDNIILAKKIKNINKNNIKVGIRFIDNKFEYWVVCKEKNFEILDKIYDIYVDLKHCIDCPVEFVFINENQFVGKDNISFSILI